MSKIFQVVDGRCHWRVPPPDTLESIRSKFPPDCQFEETPDCVMEQWGFDESKEGDDRFIRPETPPGWKYDEETGTMYPEEIEPELLKEVQDRKQNENKMQLAKYLRTHPLTVNGKQYGITQEDQNEISLNIAQYTIQVQAGIENPVLEWHAIKEACTPWTIEALSALVIAISNTVYPWFSKMEKYKAAIYACTERKQVNDLILDYSDPVPNGFPTAE